MINDLIPYHYTWEIQDSSKVQDAMTCMRRYFYNYILGWQSDAPNNHLVFGSAWHDAYFFMATMITVSSGLMITFLLPIVQNFLQKPMNCLVERLQ